MSGHSHFKTIKAKKSLEDQKRGKIFSKLTRLISVAAKEGKDPGTNSKLRQALEEAKSFNMPRENIERAIKRGTGELEGEKLEEILIEALDPSGIAIIISGITDNKNRALIEIKQALQKHSAKLADSGSLKWQFDKKGCLVIDTPEQSEEFKNKEELGLKAIELGAEDIYFYEKDNILDIFTKPDELDKVKKGLEALGIKISSSSLDWVPKEYIIVDEKEKENCQKLFDALDELDSVQDIYSNIELP